MCRVLRIQRSGYYARKAQPKSKRTLADESLMASIKRSFESSQGIYGSPRVHCDLPEEGIACDEKRVARLMRQAQLHSVRGYKRPRYRAGTPATTAPDRLQREFTVAQPDQVWVTDITESFFSSLKKERIKRCIYANRQNTKSDMFDYIEVFYNRVRRHSRLDQLSPMAFE